MKKLPIFLALDVDDEKQALNLAENLAPYVLGFKIGPRLYLRSSVSLIQDLSKLGEVFLDFKFHDIPSTMAASVKTCFEKGIKYVTVHAEAGETALFEISKVEKDYKDHQVLAVTVLTSQSKNLKQKEKVFELAKRVYESHLTGLVASAFEVQDLRKKYPSFFIVTPGIRTGPISKDDQQRVMSPGQALALGSSALVMGRPILQSLDPVKYLKTLKDSLNV